MDRDRLRRVRRSDTEPERRVRSCLHARGLRFRTNLRIGTGRSAPRPDIAFTRQKVAVFIDGCFWHQCPEHATMPKASRTFWEPKLRRNVERDLENNAALEAMGWTVLRFWEHEDPEEVAAAIEAQVRP
jgi:DNA mismatch endonuclease (patch repair protein)